MYPKINTQVWPYGQVPTGDKVIVNKKSTGGNDSKEVIEPPLGSVKSVVFDLYRCRMVLVVNTLTGFVVLRLRKMVMLYQW